VLYFHHIEFQLAVKITIFPFDCHVYVNAFKCNATNNEPQNILQLNK